MDKIEILKEKAKSNPYFVKQLLIHLGGKYGYNEKMCKRLRDTKHNDIYRNDFIILYECQDFPDIHIVQFSYIDQFDTTSHKDYYISLTHADYETVYQLLKEQDIHIISKLNDILKKQYLMWDLERIDYEGLEWLLQK